MGKNYYCEYCDKRFKDDKNIRKKHIDGLYHQTAVKRHYAKFKGKIWKCFSLSLILKIIPIVFYISGPKEILIAESKKKFCTKFQSGSCQFGALCRFSHYTPDELAEIQQRGTHL